MILIEVRDSTFPLAHHGHLVESEQGLHRAATAETIWLFVSDEKNKAIETKSAPSKNDAKVSAYESGRSQFAGFE